MNAAVDQLESLARMQPERALVRAASVLHRRALSLLQGQDQPGARSPRILDLLPDAAGPLSGPVFTSLPAEAGLTLQLFAWPAGVWTPIHDHTSWGMYLCLDGQLVEDRYVRLDDNTQAGRAQLRHAWRATWRPGQHSTLLPYARGIHRVGNPTGRRAISLHLYGPPQSGVDGRDYEPTRDFVCDRPIPSPAHRSGLLAA